VKTSNYQNSLVASLCRREHGPFVEVLPELSDSGGCYATGLDARANCGMIFSVNKGRRRELDYSSKFFASIFVSLLNALTVFWLASTRLRGYGAKLHDLASLFEVDEDIGQLVIRVPLGFFKGSEQEG
jgi:hypothetical protein